MYLCVWRDNICDFEQDWIKFLLPNKTVYIDQNEKDEKYPNTPCIYITSFWHDFEQQLQNVKHPFGIIYLSEEILSNKIDYFLANPLCQFVWRNYIHPNYINHPKVTFFPCAISTRLSLPIVNQLQNKEQELSSTEIENYLTLNKSVSDDDLVNLLEQEDIEKLKVNTSITKDAIEGELSNNIDLEQYITNEN